MWPQKWSVEWLKAEQASDPRGFAKSYMNQPISIDGIYWAAENFTYGDVDPCSFTVLSVDPAVTSKSTSDYSAFAVVGYSKSQDRFVVRHASQVKISTAALRMKVIALLNEYPEVTAVLPEVNQGEDLWTSPGGAFWDLPNVKVITVHQTEAKTLRAERALLEYTKGRVYHEKRFPELERQQLAFPNVINDDLIDAVGTAINTIRKSVVVDQSNNRHRGIVMGRNRYAG
jgi:phage terminase large subunit-like protein